MRCSRQQPQTAIHRVQLGALREQRVGDWLPPKQGEPCHRVLRPRAERAEGSGSPQAGGPCHPRPRLRPPRGVPESPAHPPRRPQRRPRCDARGGEAAARAFAWAGGKAASPVCFIFSWQLRTARRSSAPPAGRAGRQPREDRGGRAGGRTDGAPAERGYRGRAAASRAAERRRTRLPPRRLRAGRGRDTQAAASGVPSLRPRLTPGCRLGAWLLPRRSRGAPGPCRWPVLGWSWERFSLLPSPPSLSWPSPRLRNGSR